MNDRYLASVEHMRSLAQQLGRRPSQAEYNRTRPSRTYSRYTICIYLGGWWKLVRAAGLDKAKAPPSGPAPRTGTRVELCECGEPVEHKVIVPCGGSTTLLLLCHGCYQVQLEVGR